MSALGSPGRYGGQAAFAGVVLILAAATALLAGAGAWSWRELSDQWARYQAYQDLQRNAGRADSLSAAYDALAAELEALGRALPAENQGSHVLNLLVEEAGRRELGISGITALDAVPFPGYAELPFQVGLAGTFPDLARFLHSLETQGMALQVRRLHVEGESLNRNRVRASLDLSVFSPGASRGRP
jgi:Tfp pilus assembly protein PilO